MNQLTICVALISLFCVQTLAVETQGDAGYMFEDEKKLEEAEEEGNLITGLVDYIECTLLHRFLQIDEDRCKDLAYDMVSVKRSAPGRGTLGLMFGRRSSDVAKRNNGRRQVGNRGNNNNNNNRHGITRGNYWQALYHMPVGKRSAPSIDN